MEHPPHPEPEHRPRPRFLGRFALAMDRTLLLLTALVGVLAALVALAYYYALEGTFAGIEWLSHLTFHGMHLPVWALMAVIGALVGAFYSLGHPGETDAVVDNIHVENGKIDLSANLPLIPVSLLSIAAGGSAGPEAPMVHLTGSVGTWLHKRLKLPEQYLRPLTFAGMGVGFATLFGAPIGSTIFALEIPHKRGMEYYEALIPALIGGLAGYAVFATVTHHGLGATWTFPAYHFSHPMDLFYALGMGLVGALGATAIVLAIHINKKLFEGVKLPMFVKAAMGGLALGLLAWKMPETRFFGEEVVNQIASGSQTAGFLFALAGLKALAIGITLASGWRGGIIIPCFLTGVCLGKAMSLIVPGLDPTLAMICGAAAVNVAVMKVPVGTLIVLLTMTGIDALAPLSVACLVAFLITGGLGVIDSQRARSDAKKQADVEEEDGRDEIIPA
jgi:H+/Cl- antiporter ClcA